MATLDDAISWSYIQRARKNGDTFKQADNFVEEEMESELDTEDNSASNSDSDTDFDDIAL